MYLYSWHGFVIVCVWLCVCVCVCVCVCLSSHHCDWGPGPHQRAPYERDLFQLLHHFSVFCALTSSNDFKMYDKMYFRIILVQAMGFVKSACS